MSYQQMNEWMNEWKNETTLLKMKTIKRKRGQLWRRKKKQEERCVFEMKKKLSVYNCYVYDDLENEREKKNKKDVYLEQKHQHSEM